MGNCKMCNSFLVMCPCCEESFCPICKRTEEEITEDEDLEELGKEN
ncbi:hypothetical protein [Bacillus sp. Fil]